MHSMKLLSGTLLSALVLAGGTVPSRAAMLEEDKSGSWTLNAYSDDSTGAFQSCTMTAPADHEVSLVFTLTGSLTWTMWLYKQNWNWSNDKDFIATVNVDRGRKVGLVFDGNVNSATLIALRGADFGKLFSTMRSGRQLHATLPRKLRFAFSISGTRDAVEWVTDCAKRHQEQASAPRPNGPPAEDDNGVTTRPNKPQNPPKDAIPLKPSDDELINVQNDTPTKPATTQTQVAATDPSTQTPPATNPTQNIALTPPANPPVTQPATATPPNKTTIDAAATPPTYMPANTRSIDARMTAMSFLPRLMAEANRNDFKVLDPKDVPSRVTKADLVFSINGLTGTVLVTDFATARAASNELLAMDNIACTGTSTSGIDPDKDGRVDVSHAFAACDVGGKTSMARYTALSRKDGGYFVVGVIDDGSGQAPTTFQEVDSALFSAAMKLSGKF
ncbi:MAG: hypothetical protein P4L82_06750 [Ancalomicrobiaceae bacterium]|nr:hypothetical protein [Ancalomicrobiaceae bacterium]